jgi:hypothetical protein
MPAGCASIDTFIILCDVTVRLAHGRENESIPVLAQTLFKHIGDKPIVSGN